MTRVVIQCLFSESCVKAGLPEPRGLFLADFDPEAYDGTGDTTWTGDLQKAMVFESHEAAFLAWKTQSVTMPTRSDGKPNRPLTAFTITTVPVKIGDD